MFLFCFLSKASDVQGNIFQLLEKNDLIAANVAN